MASSSSSSIGNDPIIPMPRLAASSPGPPEKSWVLEFILRQPIDDSIANDIFIALPLPYPTSLSLKKTILLRHISSEISRFSVSDRIMTSLEFIEELDRTAPSCSMIAAYCSVAVECTVIYLRCPGGDFSAAVEKIWSCRLADLERSGDSGLVSLELKGWRKVMEEAVNSSSIREQLIKRDTRKEAVDAVRAYVEEATEAMSPSFLDLAAEAVRGMKMGSKEQLAGSFDGIDSSERDNAMPPQSPRIDQNEVGGSATQQEVTNKDGCSTGKFDYLPTPVVSKVTNALKKSCAELLMAGEDPLPDALAAASKIIDKGMSVAQKEGTSTGNDKQKPSLMNRNQTAHTFEWGDDSIDSPSESSPSPSKKPRLVSPRRGNVSPLKLLDIKKLNTRRKMKRWTSVEEETLRQAVQKYGAGNWKLILSCYTDTFEDRTEVDLKDKWRNMTR